MHAAQSRGHFQNDWLDSYHTFSFGEYYNPQMMGFATLRVINEDRVEPAKGFATHPHRDMEIITYVMDGALAHKDSLGNGSTIQPGEIQRMSAGSGITHSEFNANEDKLVHFYQIWILPAEKNIEPGYEQKSYDQSLMQNQFSVLASPTGSEPNAVKIHQDAKMSVGVFDADSSHSIELNPNKLYWLQVAQGELQIDDLTLKTSDALAIKNESILKFSPKTVSELILFEVNEK